MGFGLGLGLKSIYKGVIGYLSLRSHKGKSGEAGKHRSRKAEMKRSKEQEAKKQEKAKKQRSSAGKQNLSKKQEKQENDPPFTYHAGHPTAPATQSPSTPSV